MGSQADQCASSDHYLGEKGRAYFAWQNKGELQRGRINARKFVTFVRSTDIVLDFGCGNGSLLFHLDCRRRIGVEINPIARAVAEQMGIEVHATLDTVPDKSVDTVISNHALEHTLCPYETLRALRGKLLEDGRLVLCLPIDDWRTQKAFVADDINHHLYTWSPLILGNLLIEAGYRPERIWLYTHAWPPTHWQKLDQILPARLFNILCYFTALRFKRRQIMAFATKR
ncbi:MAG: class I SAM-dependent methyltransferase [bacterium]